MEEVPTGWQPDPFGLHEMRFISSDGLPTKLVSDGDTRSYDNPPAVVPSPSVPAPEQQAWPREEPAPAPQSWPLQHPAPAAPTPPAAPVEPSWPLQQPAPLQHPEPTYAWPLADPAPTPTNIAPPEKSRGNGQNGHGSVQLSPQTPRLALLCGNCGQRHNASDGMCPQCGEGPRLTGLLTGVPAPGASMPSAPMSTIPVAVPPAPATALPDPNYPSAMTQAPASQPMADHRPPPPAGFATPALQSAHALEARPRTAPPSSVNPFAIASLVLSLVAIPIAGSVLAIVFGVMAKRQIRETRGGQGGETMATWGIVLGCVGILAAIIVAFVLALGGGSSNALSPGGSASVRAAFTSAAQPLDTADATLSKAIAGNAGGSVAQLAQAVTPYVTALNTFDYKIHQISWTPAEQLESERLEIQAKDVVNYASTISSTTSATSAAWVTHLQALGASAQSSDNALRSMVGVAKVSDFP